MSTRSSVTELHLRDEENREEATFTDYLRQISFYITSENSHQKITQDDWVRVNAGIEPSLPTSDVNIPAHVPIHHTTTGLVTSPLFMASQILYSSVPPTWYQKNIRVESSEFLWSQLFILTRTENVPLQEPRSFWHPGFLDISSRDPWTLYPDTCHRQWPRPRTHHLWSARWCCWVHWTCRRIETRKQRCEAKQEFLYFITGRSSSTPQANV